jgi:hypothetical protein
MASTLGNKQVALSTTAAKVVDSSTKKSVVKIKNLHATILVYVGKTGVTAATGYQLAAAGGEVTLTFDESTPEVYAVAASGTPSVAVLRVA